MGIDHDELAHSDGIYKNSLLRLCDNIVVILNWGILTMMNKIRTEISMAAELLKYIEVVHINKQPISPNSLNLYQITEEDTKNIELPSNMLKLSNDPVALLNNCFSEASKIPQPFLAVRLAQLSSFPMDKLSHLTWKQPKPTKPPESVFDSQNGKDPLFISFMGRVESIRNCLIYITIQDCRWRKGASDLQIRNSKGELLVLMGGLRIQEPDKASLKKFQSLFKGGNIIIIVNGGQNSCSMDCAYFDQLHRSQNNFLYIQNQLRMQTVFNIFDGDDTILSLNKAQYPGSCLYFIITEKYGTMICSKLCLRLYIKNHIDQVIEEHNKLRRQYEQEFHNLNIQSTFEEYTIFVRPCILNIMLTNDTRRNKLSFQEAVYTLINFLLGANDKPKTKGDGNAGGVIDGHFLDKMKDCKECRVCLKKFIDKKGYRKKKSLKKSLKQLERNGSQDEKQEEVVTKIKKTKYCCERCSIHYGRKIPICVLCMKEFHENVPYFMGNQYKPEVEKTETACKIEKNQFGQSENEKSDEKLSIQSNVAVLSDVDEGRQTAEELVSAMKMFNSQIIDYISRLQERLNIPEDKTTRSIWNEDLD